MSGYGINADATWLLDHHEVHLLLHANPDGRKRAEAGLSWRKNHNTTHCPTQLPGVGVDLNRNFPFQWDPLAGNTSDQECSQVYRGPSANSEPETQAIGAYIQGLFPDARGAELDAAAPSDTSGIFLDIHSYGGLTLWPWNFTDTVAPNGMQLQTLGRKLAYFNGYEPQQSVYLYAATGTTRDYGYGELGRATYVFEVGTSFFQDCASFAQTVLPGNLAALRYALKVVRTPYLTPAGPDAVGVTTSAGSPTTAVPAGTAVTLCPQRSPTPATTQGTAPKRASPLPAANTTWTSRPGERIRRPAS